MKFISSWNCFFASKNFNHCLQTFGVIATASSASQAARPLLPARRGKHTHLHLRRNRGHQIGGAMRSKYSMEEHTHIYIILHIYISYNSIFPSCRVPRKKTVTSNFRKGLTEWPWLFWSSRPNNRSKDCQSAVGKIRAKPSRIRVWPLYKWWLKQRIKLKNIWGCRKLTRGR